MTTTTERVCQGCGVDLSARRKGTLYCTPECGTMWRTYGIGLRQYEALLTMQGSVCAICRRRQLRSRLAIDHDHKTGRVRGLLCLKCNHELLNAGRHQPAVFQRAADYLLRPPFDRLPAA